MLITVGELKKICEEHEKRYGSDSKVSLDIFLESDYKPYLIDKLRGYSGEKDNTLHLRNIYKTSKRHRYSVYDSMDDVLPSIEDPYRNCLDDRDDLDKNELYL